MTDLLIQALAWLALFSCVINVKILLLRPSASVRVRVVAAYLALVSLAVAVTLILAPSGAQP